MGQIQLVLDALFVFACYSYLRHQRMLSGFLIGLSTLIKPQMALFLIWGLLRRDWPFTVSWLLPVVLGFSASAVLYGSGWPVEYLKVLSFIGSHGESFFPNQSVNGLLNRLLQNGNNLEWWAPKFAPSNPVVHGATLLSSALIVVIGLAFDRQLPSGGCSVTSMMFAGVCFSMGSPVVWEHHYGVILPLFAFCFVSLLAREYVSNGSFRAAWLVLAVTFFLSANSLAMINWLADTPFNALQSYLLFAAIGALCLTWTLASRSRAGQCG